MKKQFHLSSIALLFAITLLGYTNLVKADAKVGGFVDGQFQYIDNAAHKGFVVNDGAIYFSAEMGGTTGFIDLPFAASGTAGSDDFTIGGGRWQAYLSHQYDCGFGWSIGQWDTIFGAEGNDTKDVVFSTQGLVFAQLMPVVHSGLLANYKRDMVEVKLLFANKAGEGTRQFLQNMELGGQIMIDGGMFHIGAGSKGYKEGTETEILVDVLAGVSVDRFSFDVEFAYIADPITSATLVNPENRWGLLGIGVFEATDRLNLSFRGEYLKKAVDASGTLRDSQFQLTVGPQFKVNDSLTAKFDYTFNSAKTTSGSTSDTTSSANIGAVFTM